MGPWNRNDPIPVATSARATIGCLVWRQIATPTTTNAREVMAFTGWPINPSMIRSQSATAPVRFTAS